MTFLRKAIFELLNSIVMQGTRMNDGNHHTCSLAMAQVHVRSSYPMHVLMAWENVCPMAMAQTCIMSLNTCVYEGQVHAYAMAMACACTRAAISACVQPSDMDMHVLKTQYTHVLKS